MGPTWAAVSGVAGRGRCNGNAGRTAAVTCRNAFVVLRVLASRKLPCFENSFPQLGQQEEHPATMVNQLSFQVVAEVRSLRLISARAVRQQLRCGKR